MSIIPTRWRARRRARRAAREWLYELDRLGSDWEAAGVLWQFIGVWLSQDELHCAVFLPEFRRWAARERRARPESLDTTSGGKRLGRCSSSLEEL